MKKTKNHDSFAHGGRGRLMKLLSEKRFQHIDKYAKEKPNCPVCGKPYASVFRNEMKNLIEYKHEKKTRSERPGPRYIMSATYCEKK